MKHVKFPPRLESKAIGDEWNEKIQGNVLLQGTRLKKSPFFESTLRAGCDGYSVYNKTLFAQTWKDQNQRQEYDNLCRNVNLYDASIQRQVEISGPDASHLVQYLCTRNMSKQKIGQCMYTLCTDEEGVVINDPLVLKLAEDRFWLSVADRDLVLWAKAHSYNKDFDVAISDPDVSSIAVQGPKSLPLVCELFGEDMSDIKFFHFKQVTWHGIPTVVARAGWSPERGYEIYMDGHVSTEVADNMWNEVVEKGKQHNIMFSSPNNSRRLEGGMLSTCDYENTELDALELDLPKKFVNLTMEQDFIGKQALQVKSSTGLERKVVGIIFEHGAPIKKALTHAWQVDGVAPGVNAAGYVTSVGYSPILNTFIGVATMPIGLSTEGTKVAVETPEGSHPAVVSAMPFPKTINVDHKGGQSLQD